MTIYKANFPEAAEMLAELIRSKQEGLIVEIASNYWLATGLIDGTYSKTAQQELDIPVFQSQHIGGTCVVFPGDISFLELKKGNSDFGKRAINAIKKYLEELGMHIRNEGNDLMLYESSHKLWLKVASYGSGWLDKGYMQSVVHVSIGMDESLVNKICTKPCVKKPGGLGVHGVTPKSIYDVVKQVFEKP